MDANDIIAQLQSLVKRYGNLPVITDMDNEVSAFEYNDDDEDEPVFVIVI